jgi:hypothetical protein
MTSREIGTKEEHVADLTPPQGLHELMVIEEAATARGSPNRGD